MTEPTPQTQLAEITDAVSAARQALLDGADIDLTGLDSAVARVCGAASALPQTERSGFADKLVSLADALDDLALELARRGNATERRRAADAYRDGA